MIIGDGSSTFGALHMRVREILDEDLNDFRNELKDIIHSLELGGLLKGECKYCKGQDSVNSIISPQYSA